ncbi:alpha/beta fold hydrolase [Mesobacterium sp. TK19101]|uniref:Alpha/beta fold hydrolase n=1 Tax=Mesobacterium hydrothermale TaxID=3111907 RepID=A0ABU6HK00_9RHOB|nr:alpha/beta fold hydrolase [Mesobacterium sp. TK19101]MEC3862236.1 alpha/beta fold hydrolase [Mesobacterium sp. TK19101]
MRHVADTTRFAVLGLYLVLRILVILVLVAGVGGCAPRGALHFLPGAEVEGAAIQRVFVATNRNLAQPDDPRIVAQSFGATRDPALHYARLDISIPPTHAEGQIEWPGAANVDPAKHFVVTDSTRLASQRDFLRAIDAALPTGSKEVVVFVHGYNVNNAEAVYRLAQIGHDFRARAPVVAYSWPSAGSPRGYVYDRDSVIFSRDGLETFLTDLTAGGKRRVLLVGHSMGTQLVMEVLRQISISGDKSVLRRLNGVALISPDIDEDVFRRQAARISPFPEPFLLAVSQDDLFLNISAWMTGKPTRLGSIGTRDALSDLPVQVVDLSGLEGGDRGGQSTAFTAPAAIERLRSLAGR